MDPTTKQAGHCKYETDLESADGAAKRAGVPAPKQPCLWGVPLKYLSLLTLALQNSTLSILMHYSRIPSSAATGTYSAATAVLMSELLKGLISLVVAFARVDISGASQHELAPAPSILPHRRSLRSELLSRTRKLGQEVFSPDCWKLSIPAILYVLQNNLQYVAASNLAAATFQVTYQMKILTTAIFSVILLRKRLTSTQWFSLVCLAVGVAIVQIQAGLQHQAASNASAHAASMNPLKGFSAVSAACFTSGLAGVYFEMVLKKSKTDLWVRNVQLSFFSLLPAVAPVMVEYRSHAAAFGGSVAETLFRNFTPMAWGTILVQVLGGLITALVIKYSDNILKGFATSLSIVISFVASVALFRFRVSATFMLGSSIVLAATYLYNTPTGPTQPSTTADHDDDDTPLEKLRAEDFELPTSSRPSLGSPSASSSSLSSTVATPLLPYSRSVEVLFDGDEPANLHSRSNTQSRVSLTC